MFKYGRKEQQITMDSPIMQLPKSLVESLEKGWAGSFYANVFLSVNEDRFPPMYSQIYSRPNRPVNILISLLLLKELHGLTDEQLIASLYFDYRFQYALGISDIESEGICINTLTNFRMRLLQYEAKHQEDLFEQEMKALSDKLAELVGMNKSMARMDSFMVSSACKKLSRLELVYRVVTAMIEALHKQDKGLVPEAFQDFLKEGYRNTLLYHTRSEEAGSKLEHLIDQASELYNHVNRLRDFHGTTAYQQLTRLLREQCIETEEGVRIAIEGAKLKPDGLQNPSDSSATYRNKGGKGHIGYVTNIVEVRDVEKDLGLILDFDVQPNIHSDAAFGEAFVQKSPLAEDIEVLAVDGAYYREETVKAAESKNIEMNFSNMTGRKAAVDHIPVTQFEVNDEQIITACPAGHAPLRSSYNEEKQVYKATFDKGVCQTCPMLSTCPVQQQVKNNTVRFTETKRQSDATRIKHGTERHRELSRFRAGVEGMVSAIRRRFDVDNLPVFGLLRSKMWISAKIGAFNFSSVFKYQTRMG
ncbi:transposase [Paenibacillus alkaliterrae]|uniref:transposase n=1 Tax=Paenibacillus alkaliterrae TaxID=320909 RepID=UPI001F28EE4E|nr:transposase [Paenibacillus alkaliterrae]MCF2939662.1 transposase [Paenibacillus alkaliterrae]